MSNGAQSLTFFVLSIGFLMVSSMKINSGLEHREIAPSVSVSASATPSSGHTLPNLSEFALGSQCPRILQIPAGHLSIEFNDYYAKEKRADQIIRLLKGKAFKGDGSTITGWGMFYSTAAPDRNNLDYVVLYEENGTLKEIGTKALSQLIGHDIQEWEVNTIRQNKIC